MEFSQASKTGQEIAYNRARIRKNKSVMKLVLAHAFYRKKDECWNWPDDRNPSGYGVIYATIRKQFSVHRLSFEHYKGLIPRGMVVMHSCDNPPCFNPDHLFLGTQAENMQDMVRKGRHRKRVA